MEKRHDKFWAGHPGLVWSNRQANDSVMIGNALLRPHFHLLLDIAATFGINELKSRWESLRGEIETGGDPSEQADLRRAVPIVERCLSHMEAALHREKA